MHFDDLFEIIGGYGCFQIYVTALCGSLALWSVELMSQIFIAGKMNHWCSVPALFIYGEDMERHIAIPKTSTGEYQKCAMFDYDYYNFTSDELKNWNRSLMTTTNTRHCNYGWNYDTTIFSSTIVSRFDLVCDEALKVPFASTVFISGILVGALVSGPVADRLGRKTMLLIFIILKVIGCIMSTLANNFNFFATARFILGVGNSGVYLGAFVLLMEVVGPKYRSAMGVWIGLLFGLGTMIIASLAYFIRSDFHMNITMMVPNVLFLSYFVLLHESPRWLVYAKRYESAQHIIGKMAAMNRKELPADFDAKGIEVMTSTSTGTPFVLFRTPNMRKRTLIIYTIWFVVSLMYYGLTLNTGIMSGSIFLNTFLVGAVELPANILAFFLLNWHVTGRRVTTAGSGIIAGVTSFLCIPLLLLDQDTMATAFAMLGKASVTVCYTAIYVFSGEIFPTEVRNAGMGTSSCAARISAMAAPFLGAPMMNIWKPLPYLIFGVLSTCAASLALFLPETLNEKLRDTVQEVETFVGIHKVATMSQMAPVEAGVSTIGVRPSPEDVTSAGNDAQSTNEPDEQGVTIVVDPASSENVTM